MGCTASIIYYSCHSFYDTLNMGQMTFVCSNIEMCPECRGEMFRRERLQCFLFFAEAMQCAAKVGSTGTTYCNTGLSTMVALSYVQ